MSTSTATSSSNPATKCSLLDAPTDVPFGDNFAVRSIATVVRANAIERAWTRLVGNFELTELYDVSFTERRML